MSGRRDGVRLALAVARRLTSPRYRDALEGDLLEEVEKGRSLLWVWREVVVAVALRVMAKARGMSVPAAFSVAWSLLYPSWQALLWRNALTDRVFNRWSALEWPASAMLELGGGLLPPVSFLWLGLLVFAVVEAQGFRRLSPFRVLVGCSLSFSVLLATSLALLSLGASLGPHAEPMGRMIFYLAPTPREGAIPLALSLLAGVMAVRPRAPELRLS